MKIAVIDSGLPKYYDKENTYRVIVDKEYRAYLSKKEIYDENGHGTIVRNIIDKYLDKCDEVITLKILNKDLKGNSIALINAIQFCIENKIDLINISLGTINEKYKEKLHRLIKKAIQNGIIVVAAEHNDGLKSYPANFQQVIGVREQRKSLLRHRITYDHRTNFFQVGLKKIPLKILWGLKKVYFTRGSSFMAPHVTGVIIKIIKEKQLYAKELIIEEFKNNFKEYFRG